MIKKISTFNQSSFSIPKSQELLSANQELLSEKRLDSLYDVQMNIDVSAWIKAARKSAGLSQEALGERLGRTKGNVSGWENGRHQPSFEQLIQISRETKHPLPEEWRLLGAQPLQSSNSDTSAHVNTEEETQDVSVRYIPLVGIGTGGPDGYINVDDYPVGHGDGEVLAPTKDPRAYAIRVRGDSMRPRIRSGEFVVAEPSLEAQPGQDVVVKLKNGQTMVKELLYVRTDEIRLGSVNDDVAPLTIPLLDVEYIHPIAAIVPGAAAKLRARKPATVVGDRRVAERRRDGIVRNKDFDLSPEQETQNLKAEDNE